MHHCVCTHAQNLLSKGLVSIQQLAANDKATVDMESTDRFCFGLRGVDGPLGPPIE